MRLGSEEAFARFFYYFGLRPHIWGASECAPLSLSAKKLVCLVRFSRATSALEPPPYAAVLLPSAALLQLKKQLHFNEKNAFL